MSAILRCQAKNRFYESTQRLIQPRRVLCIRLTKRKMAANSPRLKDIFITKLRTFILYAPAPGL
jgi:hypothetical protein